MQHRIGSGFRILGVVKRWEHHTQSGGFDRLADVLGMTAVSRRPLRLVDKIRRKSWDCRWSPPLDLVDYSYADYLAEIAAFKSARRSRAEVVHYLYGDEQLAWILDRRSSLRGALVATFHLPWNRSNVRFTRDRLRLSASVDGMTAVSSALANQLRTEFPGNQVFYTPHGVDIDVFVPRQHSREPGPLRLLTVGSHMRDLTLLHEIIDACSNKGIEVEFEFIGPKAAWPHFTGCRKLVLRSNVSEQELVASYQRSDALLLPVISATANNSLLEAIACGLPVLSNEADGITDYLNERSGWLHGSSDLEEWLGTIRELAADPGKCTEKSAAAREQASGFSWEEVGRIFEDVYSKVIRATR